jgi:ribose transport system ATP-binding protein
MPVLEMRGVAKSYPGVRALRGVDLTAYGGEIHALIGENGAGKSTLLKSLAGAIDRDEGEILVGGVAAPLRSPHEALQAGIRIIYQEFNLVPYLSLAENIFLGREPTRRGGIDFKRMRSEARLLLDEIGLQRHVDTLAADLSIAQQQMLEIAKSIHGECRVLALDEPTAALSDREVHNLFDILRKLKERGVCLLYVSHRLEEVTAICDRVTVLRDGSTVAAMALTPDVTRDKMISLMVGRSVGEQYPAHDVAVGEPVLEVRSLAGAGAADVVKDVSFTLRKGEVLALAGLVGAGRSETARLIFGLEKRRGGQVLLRGRPVVFKSPRQAIRAGIGIVTEDRKAEGLVLGMDIRENTTLASLRRFAGRLFGWIDRRMEKAEAQKYLERLGIRASGIQQLAGELSGGNQQKVVLAKWLSRGVDVLLLDEPTRGIDVGARAEIYKLLHTLLAQDVAVLVISSDLPEVIGLADRIVVLSEGRVTGELTRAESSPEKIMRLATQLHPKS